MIEDGIIKEEKINVDEFKDHQQNYTIVDVRNTSEVKEGKNFENSIAISLAEIRERVHKIQMISQLLFIVQEVIEVQRQVH